MGVEKQSATVDQVCAGRCEHCKNGEPYTEKSKREGTYLFHAVGDYQLPCGARDIRVLGDALSARSAITPTNAAPQGSPLTGKPGRVHLGNEGTESPAVAAPCSYPDCECPIAAPVDVAPSLCPRDSATPSASATRTCRMQDGPPIPWALAEAIWKGYAKLGGDDQPLEVVDRRGGFGWDEVAYIWKHPEARRAIEAALHTADRNAT